MSKNDHPLDEEESSKMKGPTDLVSGETRDTLDECEVFWLAIRYLCNTDPEIWKDRKTRFLDGSLPRNRRNCSMDEFCRIINDLVLDDFASVKPMEEVTIVSVDLQICAFEEISVTGEKDLVEMKIAKSKIFRRIDFLMDELEEHEKELCHRQLVEQAIKTGINLESIPTNWKTIDHISRDEYWRRNPKAATWMTHR